MKTTPNIICGIVCGMDLSANKNILWSLLNSSTPEVIPDGAILTVNGEVIYAVGDSLYVFAVNSPTLLTSQCNPIKSTDNQFITI